MGHSSKGLVSKMIPTVAKMFLHDEVMDHSKLLQVAGIVMQDFPEKTPGLNGVTSAWQCRWSSDAAIWPFQKHWLTECCW